MPKASIELNKLREEEIISACLKLYETKSFKEITIKDIANETSFTRTSIYNYFQTKEEIFLALLKNEYKLWGLSLDKIISENELLNKTNLAQKIAHSLEERKNMLKLLSMNLYDIEDNSSLEHLIEFKKVYGKSVILLRKCLDKFCLDMTNQDKDTFILSFLTCVYGIYPYTVATKKQLTAMKAANIDLNFISIFDIAFNSIKKLLGE